jgi:outer membrane protein assembly factor BamB
LFAAGLACAVLLAPVASTSAATPALTRVPVASLSASDWSQFQGSASHVGTSAGATFEPPLRRLWRFPDPEGTAAGLSGAAVVGDVAIAAGEKAVYGVDLSTGALRWQVPRNGGRISSPAAGVADGKAVVVFTEGDTRSKSNAVAFDASTQQELWRQPLEGVSVSGVSIDDQTVLLGDRQGRLYAFDLATGHPASWSPRGLGARIDAPPAADGDQVYTVIRNGDTSEVSVVAVDEQTGAEKWTFAPHLAAGTGSDATIEGDHVFFGMGGELRVRALARLGGDDDWQARTRDSFSPLASPAFADGRLFVVSTNASDSALYAFDAADGSRLWDFQFQDASLRSSPVVVGDTAYVGTDTGIVAGIDVRSGNEVWLAGTGPGRLGPLAIAGDTLVASKRGPRGGLFAFGPDPSGHLLNIESPTKLHLGQVLARYAGSLVAVAAVCLGLVAVLRRRVAPVAGPAEPNDDPETPDGDDADTETDGDTAAPDPGPEEAD